MKEALIAGAAVFLLSYLFITTLIKISRALDIEEGYALYKYENGSGTLYSIELEDIVRGYILITDSNKVGHHGRNCN